MSGASLCHSIDATSIFPPAGGGARSTLLPSEGGAVGRVGDTDGDLESRFAMVAERVFRGSRRCWTPSKRSSSPASPIGVSDRRSGSDRSSVYLWCSVVIDDC